MNTPGPWTMKSNGDIYDARGDYVAACYAGDLDDQEANARLIAAAPELLAALKECLPLFDMVTALTDQSSDALGQAENLIRMAIAKAEGRSNG